MRSKHAREVIVASLHAVKPVAGGLLNSSGEATRTALNAYAKVAETLGETIFNATMVASPDKDTEQLTCSGSTTRNQKLMSATSGINTSRPTGIAGATTDSKHRNANFHTVKRGDTFSGIAKKLGVPLNDLKRLNPKMAGADGTFNLLFPDQKIRLPPGKSAAAETTPATTHAHAPMENGESSFIESEHPSKPLVLGSNTGAPAEIETDIPPRRALDLQREQIASKNKVASPEVETTNVTDDQARRTRHSFTAIYSRALQELFPGDSKRQQEVHNALIPPETTSTNKDFSPDLFKVATREEFEQLASAIKADAASIGQDNELALKFLNQPNTRLSATEVAKLGNDLADRLSVFGAVAAQP